MVFLVVIAFAFVLVVAVLPRCGEMERWMDVKCKEPQIGDLGSGQR